MNTADQTNFPVDHLGIFGAGENREGLAATWTALFALGEMVKDLLGGKVVAALSTIALGSYLFAPPASLWGRGLQGLGRALLPAGLISNLRGLLGLSAEDLLLEPGHLGPQGLKLLSQLGDLSLLITNDLLEPLNFGPGGSFPFDGPGMQRPVVVGLLAEFDHQTARRSLLNAHAATLPTQPICVQQ
jgi:hypothetical protein